MVKEAAEGEMLPKTGEGSPLYHYLSGICLILAGLLIALRKKSTRTL